MVIQEEKLPDVLRDIHLRPIEQQDQRFLLELYGSTRRAELAQVPWSSEEKDRFIRFQFHAQSTYWSEHFPRGDFRVILRGSDPIGRLYLDYREEEIRIVDIAMMPQFQKQGIGTALLKGVLDRAKQENLAVRIHVEQNNPALRLYHRLGFVELEEHGVYFLMEWRPAGRRE